jgi:hypothetical protein
MHATPENTVSTVSSVGDERPAGDVHDNSPPDLSARARSGRSLPQLPTMLTVLTQIPPFVSANSE